MSGPGDKPRPPRPKVLLQALLGLLVLLLFVSAGWYLASPRFNQVVRGRVVAKLEQVTGGRVEMGSFQWNLSRLEFDARDITLHGLEPPGALPYAHADRLLVHLKLLSLLHAELGFRYIEVDRPAGHLIVYEDGTTNQPVPRVQASAQNPVQRLFELAIGRLVVRNGELVLKDRRLPLDFTANDVQAGMSYSAFHRRYEGSVRLGKLDTTWRNFRPLASTAEMQFSLRPSQLEVKSLKWTAERSTLTASGRVSEFQHPRFEGVYDATLDLGQLGAVARVRPLRGGVLEVRGHGAYSLADFSAAGMMLVRDLDWNSPAARVRGATVEAQFEANRQRVALTRLSGRLFGGSLAGDAEVVNWANWPASGKGGKRLPAAEEQRGTVHLRWRDLALSRLAAAVATAPLPLDRLNLAGTTAGSVDASWRNTPRNTVAAVALEVTPPARVAPGQLPVTAHFRGTYRGSEEELEVAELEAATRATRLDAGGTLGPTGSNLHFALNTTDLGELQPVLALFQGPATLPVKLHGHASFTGTASGTVWHPSLQGHLLATNFDSVAPPPPSTAAATAPSVVHWDLLSAEVQLSPSLVAVRNGLLQHGRTSFHLDGSATLSQRKFTDTSPFTARLVLRNTELAELETLTGYHAPVSGTVNLSLQVAGTMRDPRGGGRLQVSNASLYGEPVSFLNSDLAFANHELQLNNTALEYRQAHVNGNLAYNLQTTAFRFHLAGSNFDLARLPKLQGSRMTVLGRLDFTAQGAGTPAAPVINASLHLHDLVLNGERAGDFDAEGLTRGADMWLTGRSNFEHAELAVDGSIHLRDDWPANFVLRFTHLDVDPLLHAYLRGRLTGHSAVAGTLRLHGPLRRAADLEVGGDLSQLFADIENLKIQNDGPVRFSVEQRVLSLERLRLVGDGTDITAGGTVQLAGECRLNLKANGRVNLRLIETLYPDVSSSGFVHVGLNVGGTISDPSLSGQVQISNAGFSYVDLPSGLSNVNGVLAFNQDRLEIQSLTGQVGGGNLDIGGFITYAHNVNFNLSARGQDIRLRYPPGMSTTANADLRLSGSLANSTLAGDLMVTRFALNPRFDLATYLVRSKQPPILPNPRSPLNNLRLDVHIVTTPELQVQTSMAKLSGDADLRLRGTGTHPTVLGRVNILEGEVNFNGTRYRLERGDITFTNPVAIEPVLDLEAGARVRDYDITIGFHGPPDKLSTTYRSDPPLPTGDIIALLALGRTREEATLQSQPESTFTESASNAILGQALNSTVSNRVEKLFGASRIKIDPQAVGTEVNPGTTRITVEQQVSHNFTLTYITNVGQYSQQIIQVEYYLTGHVSVVAIRDQNGVVGFDVRVRQRKK